MGSWPRRPVDAGPGRMVIVCRPSAPRHRPARPPRPPARSRRGRPVPRTGGYRTAGWLRRWPAAGSARPRCRGRRCSGRRGRRRSGAAAPHRWRELIRQEVRRVDSSATPPHRGFAGTGALRPHVALTGRRGSGSGSSPPAGTASTSGRQHLVPCLWLLLIGRDWYQLSAWNPTEDGCCRHCGTRCAGRLEGPPEGWGSRWVPVVLHQPPAALGPRGIVLEPSGLPLAA